MRLEVPSAKQFTVFVKYSILIAVPFLVVAWWAVKNDPNLTEVEQYLSKNTEIINKVGSVKSLRLVKATYVQDAIDHDGNMTPGYNLYRYTINGATDKLSVTVKVDKTNTGQVKVFRVKDMSPY